MREIELLGEQIGIGATASVYEYNSNKIVKLYYAGVSLDVIKFEFDISCSLNSTGLSPETYEIVKYQNRYGIIMERIEGKTIVANLPRKLLRIKKVTRDFARLQLSFHSTTNETLPDYTQEIKASIQRTQLLSKTEKEQILEILHSLPQENKICHGDYHPDNVIIRNDEKMIAIDWINARKGHPLLDFSRSIILMKYGSPPSNPVVKLLIKLIRSYFLNSYIKYYKRTTGYDFDRLDEFMLPVMAARLIENQGDEKNLLKEIRKRLKP